MDLVEYDLHGSAPLPRLKEPHDRTIEIRRWERQILYKLCIPTLDRLEGGHDPAEQVDRVVVSISKAEPGSGARVAPAPLRREGRLAVTSRGLDQHHRAGPETITRLEEAVALDFAWTGRRR